MNRTPLPADIRAYAVEAWASGAYANRSRLREHLVECGFERVPAISTIGNWIGRTRPPSSSIEATGRRLASEGLDVGAIRASLRKSHGVSVADEAALRWITEVRVSGLRIYILDTADLWARSSAGHSVSRCRTGYVAKGVDWSHMIRATSEHSVLCALSRIIGDFALWRLGQFTFLRYAAGRRYEIPLVTIRTRAA